MKVLSQSAAAAKTGEIQAEEGAVDDARYNAVLEEFGTLLHQAVSRACPRDRGIQLADVEQDARIRLWRALKSEREIADLASYIYKIAVTATIDAVRRAKARREEQLIEAPSESEPELSFPVASAGPSPEDQAAAQSLERAVDAGLAKLALKRRRAVGLHLQGLTTREIGTVLGWSEPKARNLVYRGLADLRRELRELGIDYEA